MQRLAVEVESEPLLKRGGQEGVANNPKGSNQYQKAEVDEPDNIRFIHDTAQASIGTDVAQVSTKPSKYGTSDVYLTQRIARDRPDIHEQMKQGKYHSVRAAAVDAGIFKKRISVPDDPVKAAIALGKHFKNQDRSLLIEVLLQQPD